VQLLHELKIRSTEQEGSKTLLKIVKNPVTVHLPVGCRRIGTLLAYMCIFTCLYTHIVHRRINTDGRRVDGRR
jgi:hypothetical protein